MPYLKSIEVDSTSQYFKSVDGVLFTLDGKTLIKYPDAKALDEYVVPEGVTEISASAFFLCFRTEIHRNPGNCENHR